MSTARVISTRRCPPIRRYIFPTQSLATLTSWFQAAGADGCEDVAVAVGLPTFDGDAVAVSVIHPDTERAPGWYEQRDGPGWDEAYAFSIRHALYYLAQFHTHPPGCSTSHSPRDDAGAFCDRLGFLSIVIPDFAAHGIKLHDEATSVHERTATGGRVWPPDEVSERFIVVPSVCELQSDHT